MILKILFASIATLGLLVFAMISIWFFYIRQKNQNSYERSVQLILGQMKSLSKACVGIGDQIKLLESRIHDLRSRQDELVQKQPQEMNYQQAVSLAKHGASLEEIIAQCQLTRAEAQLIFRLHNAASRGSMSQAA